MLTLWQAEWCPYSARVRQALTELGIDFVARQVPPETSERDVMRRETRSDSIPLLVLDDGTQLDEWRTIVNYLYATYSRQQQDRDAHRRKWFDEAPRRDPQHELE